MDEGKLESNGSHKSIESRVDLQVRVEERGLKPASYALTTSRLARSFLIALSSDRLSLLGCKAHR